MNGPRWGRRGLLGCPGQHKTIPLLLARTLLAGGTLPRGTSAAAPALTLALSLAHHTLASGDVLVFTARTRPHARLGATLAITATQRVLTGTGTHRTSVRRTVTVYRVTLGGTADAAGRYSGHLRVTYRATKATAARLTLTARSGAQVLTRSAAVTIMPALSVRPTSPRGAVGGDVLPVQMHASAPARLSVTLEIVSPKTVRPKTVRQGTKRVRQEVVVYQTTLSGTTDRKGQYAGRVRVAHRVATAMQARLQVVARTAYTAATRSQSVTIQPRR